MKYCAPICPVPEMAQGPFLFPCDIVEGCRQAAEAGLHAVEVLPASAAAVDAGALESALADNGLKLAGMGSGAGFLIHGWHLCSGVRAVRDKAKTFIGEMIDLAASIGAPEVASPAVGPTAMERRLTTSLFACLPEPSWSTPGRTSF